MSADSSKITIQQQTNNVLNNVINTNTTIRLVKSFSIPPEKIESLVRFCEIAKKQAGSRGFSEVVLKALEEYNKNHEENNPQLKLAPFIDENASSPTHVLCSYLDGVTSNGRIHCRQAGFWIKGLKCYSCSKNRLRKKPQ